MKLLGIEFGGNRPINGQPEKGEGDYIEVRSGGRIQKIRQGVEVRQIAGKSTIIEKNRVNIEVYRDLIDY